MSNIEGSAFESVTIDGDAVQEITADGDVVWTASREIDHFEGYGSISDVLANWTRDGTGDESLSSTGLVPGSSQSLHQDGTAELRSMVGDGLDNYIEAGEVFTLYLRPLVGSDAQYHFLANAESGEWSTNTESWRLEFHMNSGARVVYYDGTRNIVGDYDYEYDWSVGQTYRIEIVFGYDEVGFDVYPGVDSTNRATWARTTNVPSSRIASEMNIGLRCSASWGECLWDHIGYE